MAFQTKKFLSKADQSKWDRSLPGKYYKLYKKYPFFVFGLPFMLSMVYGSVLLSNFTSIRYEHQDRKIKELDETESLKLAGLQKRKVDLKEEYYRLQGLLDEHKDWEPKRVPRRNGEDEPVW